ncbi:MAG: chorismate mutase, partial [Oscillospiraceae bacterium]|nr:chorismate mutase [Oscillospiraceae bacterium]
MDDLQSLRRDIDAIDRQLVELFRQRMDVTRRVGEYKKAKGIPVLDQERERQVLQNKGELAGEALRPSAKTNVARRTDQEPGGARGRVGGG